VIRNDRDPAGDPSAHRWPALVRDALGILVTGVTLGIAFNALGLANRPPRGIPWIGGAPRLEPLVSQAPPVETEASTISLPPRLDAPPAAEPPASAPSANRTPASSPTRALPVAKTASMPANPDTAASPPPSAPQRRAALPVIPELARPFRVDLPLVDKFVEANAALVVDARDPEAFAEGHIPGAISVPYEDAARDPTPLGKLPPGRPIIVYCGGGSCESSRLLAEMLVRDFNRRKVLVYEGGFPEWAAAGKPVARATP
jgi:rhodanese-related sulfurtransferase